MYKTTTLNCLILGLLSRSPRSGYELCKAIESTPMSFLSDSPGSIYPALKKMESHDLIEGIEKNQGRRLRKEFVLSPIGQDALEQWLMSPVDGYKLVNDPSTILLRLSFIDLLNHDQKRDVLIDFQSTLNESIKQLNAFFTEARPHMANGGHMAFELALNLLKTQLKWLKKQTE